MEQHSVQLGTIYYRDSICRRLLELRDKEELPVMLHEFQQGKRWLIQCNFEPPLEAGYEERRTVGRVYRYYLANAIAETILQNWESDHVTYLLRQKYRMHKKEGDKVLPRVLDYLDIKTEKGKRYSINRKTSLVSQILTYLETSSHFDIEGFLRFRARDYIKEVDRLVSLAVDDYLLEREYLEFIQLLKHFVDTQTPKLHTLHVGIDRRGKFHLYNDRGEVITQQFLENDGVPNGNISEFTYEDLLISSLIAVAPRQVVLHICYEGYQDTLQTIIKVFENRVSYCTGCKLCSSKNEN